MGTFEIKTDELDEKNLLIPKNSFIGHANLLQPHHHSFIGHANFWKASWDEPSQIP